MTSHQDLWQQRKWMKNCKLIFKSWRYTAGGNFLTIYKQSIFIFDATLNFCYFDDVIFWWRNSVTFIMYLVIMLHYDRSIDAMKYGTMTHSCYITELTNIKSWWITIILMKSLILTSISTAFLRLAFIIYESQQQWSNLWEKRSSDCLWWHWHSCWYQEKQSQKTCKIIYTIKYLLMNLCDNNF